MSGADNKAIVLRLIKEVLSDGNMAVVDEIIDPNFGLHLPGSQEPLRGTEGLKRAAEGFRILDKCTYMPRAGHHTALMSTDD